MSTTTYTSCLRIERTDGYVICLTELDKDLIINDTELGFSPVDQTYLSAAGYTPTNMESTSDNAVNNADVEGVLSAVGVQREDIIGGRYDFAKLHIFLWDYENDTLIKKLGSGHWGEVTIKDGSYVAEFRSLSQQLQQTIGRTYNPECDEQLGGTRCTIALGLFPKDGSITAQTSKTFLIDSSLSMPDDYWNGMEVLWNTGDNATETANVLDYIDTEDKIILDVDMPNYISLGDTYTVTKSEITGNTTTASGSTIEFTDTVLAQADNFFDSSTLTVTSGNNNTDIFTIFSYITDVITLTTNATDLFQITDSFNINKVFTGSITSVDTPDTVFSDSTRTEIDDFFNTLILEFVSTTNGNDGIQVDITDYVSTGGQFTIDDTNLIGILAIGDTYTITKVYSGSITSINKRKQFEDNTLVAADNYYTGMTVEFTGTAETSIIISYINNIFTLATPTAADIISYVYNIDYIKNSTTTDGATKSFVIDSTIGVTDYSGMYIEFESGLNEGEFRGVLSSETGKLTVITDFDYNILNGDTYKIINMTGDTYMALGEVTSVVDSSDFTATLTETGTYGNDYFNYGKLIFKSGINDEIHMEVKDFIEDGVVETNQQFNLFLPMPFEVSVGDIFQVFAGCDKRLVTCKDKFINHINFQGFPYIPGVDQISKFGGQ